MFVTSIGKSKIFSSLARYVFEKENAINRRLADTYIKSEMAKGEQLRKKTLEKEAKGVRKNIAFSFGEGERAGKTNNKVCFLNV